MKRQLHGILWLLAAFAFIGDLPISRGDEPGPSVSSEAAFLVEPYLQWGDQPSPKDNQIEILWHDQDQDACWDVTYRIDGREGEWLDAPEPTSERIAVPTIEPHRVYRTAIAGTEPGQAFDYRVSKDGEIVFEARVKNRPKRGEPHRVVIFGDCASGSPSQRRITARIAGEDPDLVIVTGDIVYSRGRISEYRERFFPVYNAANTSPEFGAPLLRSTLFVAAPGNHDIGSRDMAKYPDGLAYFLYWSQPLNGLPGGPEAFESPLLQGPETNRKAFAEAAGPRYPRMGSFSMDAGDAHWLILDANGYTDWEDPELRDWIAKDLAASQGSRWRFVAFHQPGFQSSKAHFGDQRTRVLAEAFEKGNVDLVFSGHVHNYQRSLPLRFVPDRDEQGRPVGEDDRVEGVWTLDREYDGRDHTRPDGIIYIVTGAGGANLYNPEQQDDPSSWQEFTCKFISDKHSITVMDVAPTRLVIRQVDEDGRERDRFVVTKAEP